MVLYFERECKLKIVCASRFYNPDIILTVGIKSAGTYSRKV